MFDQVHAWGMLGIDIQRNGESVQVEWPEGSNLDAIIEEMKANKAAILEYLETAFVPRWPPDMPEFHERVWHRRCLELETLGMGEQEAERNAYLAVLGLWDTIKQGGDIPAEKKENAMTINIRYKTKGSKLNNYRIRSGHEGWWVEERFPPSMKWKATPSMFQSLRECKYNLVKIMTREIPYTNPGKIREELREIVCAVEGSFEPIPDIIRKA